MRSIPSISTLNGVILAKKIKVERVWKCTKCKDGRGCMLVNDKSIFPNNCIIRASVMPADWSLIGSKEISEPDRELYPFNEEGGYVE